MQEEDDSTFYIKKKDQSKLGSLLVMCVRWGKEGGPCCASCCHLLCFTGMVEMIPNAETLRKIQVEHGVTGSFKDRPLADWLQKHNPKEDEYEKVKRARIT